MSELNNIYKKAYENYVKLNWIEPDPFGLNIFLQGHLSAKFDPFFCKQLDNLHKDIYPRRKKIKHMDIPEERIHELRDQLMPRVDAYLKAKVKQRILLEKWLNDHASQLIMGADWQIVYTSDFSTYSTQTAVEHYTKASCERMGKLLDKENIPYEVRHWAYDDDYNVVLPDPETGKYIYFNEDSQRFELGNKTKYFLSYRWKSSMRGSYQDSVRGYALYAPITKYMLDALDRRNRITLLEWAVECWRGGTNPKVSNPFLPQDIYDKSLEVWRQPYG